MKTALVCIAKNEDHYIDEWLGYHLKLGFDRIFVYQNNWRYCGDRVKYGDRVEWICFDINRPDTQGLCYNSFIQNFLDKYDFAAFFDIDEFLVLKKHRTIADFLLNYKDVDAIGVNWRIFGDSGLSCVVDENYSVLDRFTMCGKTLNRHVKLIVNLKRVQVFPVIHNICVHYTLKSAREDSTVDVSKKSYIHGPFNENNLDDNIQIAYLNHYRNKTKQENLSRATTDQNGIFYYNPYLRDFQKNFDEHNINEVQDLTARDFYYGASLEIGRCSY